jgi:hypothetical protein
LLDLCLNRKAAARKSARASDFFFFARPMIAVPTALRQPCTMSSVDLECTPFVSNALRRYCRLQTRRDKRFEGRTLATGGMRNRQRTENTGGGRAAGQIIG